MSKHTSGPWTFNGDHVVDEYGGTIADTSDRYNFPMSNEDAANVEAEIQANAHLIAAAPDLLAACKAACDAMLREDFGTLTLVPQLRAAIALAEPDTTQAVA